MKHVIWLLVAIVAVGGTVAVLKPELIENAVPGLFAGKHKKVVGERATKLTQCLLGGEYDACVNMTDPAQVRQKGEGGLKLQYGILATVLKVGKVTMDDIRLGEVTLTEKNTRASVALSVKGKNGWEEKDPSRWIRVDGEWYVSLGSN